MRNITGAAVVLGLCKLGFSTSMLVYGKFTLGLGSGELQTLAFVTLVSGNQAALFVLRERRHMWSSRPGIWVLASSMVDIAFVSVLAASGTLMESLPWQLMLTIFVAGMGFAVVLDQIKVPVTQAIKVA